MKKGTRGNGLLENFLSLQRQKLAKSFMQSDISNSTILDIGCGVVPNFLISLDSINKYGIDWKPLKLKLICIGSQRNNLME